MKSFIKIVLAAILMTTFSSTALASQMEYKKLNQRMALLYKNGRNAEAIETAEQVIKVAEQTFGKEHAYYTSSLENLALIYVKEGDFTKALSLYEQSLQIKEGMLGNDNPRLINTLEKIEKCYRELNKEDQLENTKNRIAKLESLSNG